MRIRLLGSFWILTALILGFSLPDAGAWETVGDQPQIDPGPPGTIFSPSVLQPGVIYDPDDPVWPYKMWLTGHRQSPLRYDIGLKRSVDGHTWVSYPEDGAPEAVIASSESLPQLTGTCVLKYEGSYHIWLIGNPSAHSEDGGTLYYAQSADGVSWSALESLTFDGANPENPYSPCVVLDGETLHMWFPSGEDTFTRKLYHATASIGQETTWTTPDLCSFVASDPNVSRACVLPNGSGFDMWFTLFLDTSDHGQRIHRAASADGMTWEDHGDIGLWPDRYIRHPNVIRHAHLLRMWHETRGSYGLFYAEEVCNTLPIASAGDDQTVECTSPTGTPVTLDGTSSFDPDGDELTWEWVTPEGSGVWLADRFSPVTEGCFPPGPTLVTLTVTDGYGGVSVDDVLITVIDTTPPIVVCSTDRASLWPPNHQLVQVAVFVQASDACAAPWALSVVCTVRSSEPDDGTGDGSFTGDTNGQDGYAEPVPIALSYNETAARFEGVLTLRAERDGGDSGRVYSILCLVTDPSGNETTASCVVVVPHDRRKK